MPLTSLLIANRGEIAVRLIRACRELNIRAIAVYSEADAQALHVRLADVAVPIGPSAPKESYLNVERLLAAARQSGAEALHPGYGFLSENADFAQAVHDAGLIFVGPSPNSIRAMGSKTAARALMEQHGVPIVPGFQSEATASPELFAQAAERIGYPILIKAAGGGGGRGMRVVRAPAELAAALAGAQAEAANAFGDATVFLEKFIERGRHIEFQVFGDTHGNVVHLFERECSVQRRHQKIIEESPSPLLMQQPALREAMGRAAVAAARAVGYYNAGTIEFIVDPDTLQFYFLEMNTRLQVEHPVTETITGLDLVHWQLRVAQGEALPLTQDQITARGHALECRVYAEDPAQGYLPSIGPLLKVVEPQAPGVRVDSGFASGDNVSQYYDAMLAKVITAAPDRATAIQRMRTALSQYVLLGLTTNMPFLQAILAHPVFQQGDTTTRFLQDHLPAWQPSATPPPPAAWLATALFSALNTTSSSSIGAEAPTAAASPWARSDGFRLSG